MEPQYTVTKLSNISFHSFLTADHEIKASIT